MGREPTREELAAHLDMPVDEIQQGMADSKRVLVSLDALDVGQRGEGLLEEYLADENNADPMDSLVDESLVQEVAGALQNLPERERLILSLYYNDGLTFKQIGKVLNIHESRVYQLHVRAISSLKEMLNDEQ
jgi:RNA polymerase sigma factor for flagellar operon FliA